MEKKIIIALGTGAAALIAGLTGHVLWKEHKNQQKMDEAIDKVKDMALDEISESLVEAAVAKAAQQATEKYIRQDNEYIMRDARTKMEKDVHDLVKGEYDKARDGVSEKVAEEITHLTDTAEMEKVVRKKAEDILVGKFQGDLNDLKSKASEEVRKLGDDYHHKMEDKLDEFQSDLDRKMEGFGESVRSAKRVYDAISEGYKSRDNGDGFRVKFF